MKKILGAIVVILISGYAAVVSAAEIEVKMLNKGSHSKLQKLWVTAFNE